MITIEYRAKRLAEEPENITPKNSGSFAWAGKDLDKFAEDYNFKPVTINGFVDHERELQVLKYKDGEKGVEVITPFYTHLNKKDQPCGIMVNRGWMPWDLKDFRYDRTNNNVSFTGVLYRGDAQTKYSKPN